MHIQGREFRFDTLNITVALFSGEADMDFDGRVPMWLGDDCPIDDSFCDEESFIFREAKGVLIVAVSNLSKQEMMAVNELVSASRDDKIKLLVCADQKRYLASQFDTVIRTTYDLVNSAYDLAYSVYAGSTTDEVPGVSLSRLITLVNQSKNATLISHWDARRNKNLITPYDLVEEWPFPMVEGKKVSGIYTWLNPANYRWSKNMVARFSEQLSPTLLSRKCLYLCLSGSYEPETSRNPAPDVIQIIMH